jgi:hypothetical protein
MNFSRRNETTPSPPDPAWTVICASSTNIDLDLARLPR